MPEPRTAGKKKRRRTGYNPTPEQLTRIGALKKNTGVMKELIRDRALDIGLAQIERNPGLLLEAAA